MQEIEIKVLGIDVGVVVSRLEELGATCLFDGVVKCVHFDRPEAELRNAGKLFRLRRWEGEGEMPSKFEICYKGPKQVVDGCKVREEIESTVADADLFEQMMVRSGFEVTMNNDKRRRSYDFEGFHVDIDEYPGVPAYLEIEAENREGIDRAIRLLNLEKLEQSTESADELFARLWPEVDFDRLKF